MAITCPHHPKQYRVSCSLYLPSNLQYDLHQITDFNCFLSRLAVIFAQSIEVKYHVENEDVVEAAPVWYSILTPW